MTTCPDENVIVELLHGRLAPAAVRDLEQHANGCSACATLLAGLAQLGAPGDAESAPDASRERSGYRDRPSLAGQTIGRYVVERRLGEGAMGVVYTAFDPVLDRRIALKLLRPEIGGPGAEQARARLLREARAMASLAHPNVVPVHDAGAIGDEVFLAMELVEGATLADWLRSSDRPWRDVVATFHDAGLGLAAAHDAGVLHRDFKPANVLVGHDGRARVTDFGLARPGRAHPDPRAPADASHTVAGALIGTPAYMAPEQLFLRPVDARADQFGFCVALYEALYRAPPFGGSTLAERRWNVARTPAAWPRDHRDVPRGVAAVIVRGLAARPEDRYPSMRALLDALDAAARRVDEVHIALNVALQLVAMIGHVVLVVLGAQAMGRPAEPSAPSTSGSADLGVAGTVFAVWLVAAAVLVSVLAPVGLVWTPLNALGLVRRWSWARRSTILYAAAAALTCFGLPYAVYALWSLRRPGVKALFVPRSGRIA